MVRSPRHGSTGPLNTVQVMRLRDFTNACRVLSGTLPEASNDFFAKRAAPIFVRLLEKADFKAGFGLNAEEYAVLSKGDVACAVLLRRRMNALIQLNHL